MGRTRESTPQEFQSRLVKSQSVPPHPTRPDPYVDHRGPSYGGNHVSRCFFLSCFSLLTIELSKIDNLCYSECPDRFNGGTMNVNLTPQLERLVKQKVTAGLYNNASEVVREALRLMAVRDEVANGFAQLHAGKTVALNMAAAKRMAKANAKKGRVVNPLVTG